MSTTLKQLRALTENGGQPAFNRKLASLEPEKDTNDSTTFKQGDLVLHTVTGEPGQITNIYKNNNGEHSYHVRFRNANAQNNLPGNGEYLSHHLTKVGM